MAGINLEGRAFLAEDDTPKPVASFADMMQETARRSAEEAALARQEAGITRSLTPTDKAVQAALMEETKPALETALPLENAIPEPSPVGVTELEPAPIAAFEGQIIETPQQPTQDAALPDAAIRQDQAVTQPSAEQTTVLPDQPAGLVAPTMGEGVIVDQAAAEQPVFDSEPVAEPDVGILEESPRPKARPDGLIPETQQTTDTESFMDSFIDVIGRAEGTEDHMAQEGQFTYAYGVLPSTAKSYGLSVENFPDRKSFAKAVFGEMYKQANKTYPKVFEGMTDSQKSAAMLLYINTGTLYKGMQKALENKDFVQAGKELTNVVHYTERNKNSPDFGKKFSSKGLSARRAKEYNVFAASMENMPLVDQVTVTGTTQKPTFNWLDSSGNIIYSFSSSRPMSSKSSMKSVPIPKSVLGD